MFSQKASWNPESLWYTTLESNIHIKYNMWIWMAPPGVVQHRLLIDSTTSTTQKTCGTEEWNRKNSGIRIQRKEKSTWARMKWGKSLLSFFPLKNHTIQLCWKTCQNLLLGEDFRRLADLKHRLLLETCKHERCTRNGYKIRNIEWWGEKMYTPKHPFNSRALL